MPFYLENVTDSTGKTEVKYPELRIQKNDLLSIQISSLSTKPDVSDAIFNQPSVGTASNAGAGTSGYLVDANGNIEHHRLGTIHAEGMTKEELAAEIKKRLTEPVKYLEDPTVIIRFLNFRVTVLGSVGKEGPVSIPGERANIYEVIGLAGGITEYGVKNKVKVVREVDGKREIGTIDLSTEDAFKSPYFNLVQNDLVLVGETNQRLKDAQSAKTMQKISFALTLVTVAATLTNIFIRN